MTNPVPRGAFSGDTYRNTTDSRLALPGTSWAERTSVPEPPKPPVPPPKPPKLPLPTPTALGLKMPTIKQAEPVQQSVPSWARPVTPPTADVPNWMKPPSLPDGPPLPRWMQYGPTENQPTVQAQNNEPQLASPSLEMAKDMAMWGLSHHGMQKGLQALGPRLGLSSVVATGGGLPPAVGSAALAGSGLNILDALGLYSSGGDKEHMLWQKPKYDAQGQPVINEKREHDWELGFNPKALGWNMKNFNASTTPSEDNHPALAGLTAVTNLPKSLLSLGKFFGSELPDSRTGVMNEIVNPLGNLDNHMPSPVHLRNPEAMRIERENYRRRGKKHPIYNP